MKKHGRTALGIVLVGICTGMLSGCALKKALVDDRITDGGGMVNANAPLMDVLDGDWASADGRWSAAIEGYQLELLLDGESVYKGGMTFSFDGTDTNVKTELQLYPEGVPGDAQKPAATIRQLYTENGRLYAEAAHRDGGSETGVLEKAPANG